MDTDLTGLGALAVLALIAAASKARDALRRRRKRRSAKQLPRTTIAAAPEGERVRIVATIVETPELLTAPATGRRCVSYEATIESYVGGHERWMVVAREHGRIEAVVSDGSARAIVDLATSEIDAEASVRTADVTEATPGAWAMIGRNRVHHVGKRRFRFVERALEVDTQVAVTGVAVREPDPDAPADVTGYRDGLPTRLRFSGSARQPNYVTDDATALA